MQVHLHGQTETARPHCWTLRLLGLRQEEVGPRKEDGQDKGELGQIIRVGTNQEAQRPVGLELVPGLIQVGAQLLLFLS